MLRLPPGRPSIRSPHPAALRRVWCPRCDHQFEASAKAISLRCPACTAGIEPRDLALTQSITGDVTIIGRVEVPPSMAIKGRLVCAELESHGLIKGQARVGGTIHLSAQSQTLGQISSRCLTMDPGARIHCLANIGSMTA